MQVGTPQRCKASFTPDHPLADIEQVWILLKARHIKNGFGQNPLRIQVG
ncbi:MAG: hypothetical protein H6976_01770 [Gammaproteobacteria bacterium]|nr:hypothetical protein [Gammaproteobacteria bacterium]